MAQGAICVSLTHRVSFVPFRQGLAHFHYFKPGVGIHIEIGFVGPENINARLPILEIRRDDFHRIARFCIAVFRKVAGCK